MTRFAGFGNHLTFTAAARTRPAHGKKTLRNPNFPVTRACLARYFFAIRIRSRSSTPLANFSPFEFNRVLFSFLRFLKRNFNGIF